MFYETELMNGATADKFEKWFSDTIGTDYERNEIDDGVFYFICCDLELNSEYEAIDAWQKRENKMETYSEYLKRLAKDTGGYTGKDINQAAMVIDELLEALEELLNCPDLNHDSLEDMSIKAIEKAQAITDKAKGA